MKTPENSLALAKPPRARLPTRPVIQKIETAGGLPHVLDRIVGGDTNRVIADSLGVDRGDFSAWLCSVGGAEYREALRQSGEGLLDQAEGILRAADASSMASIQKTKLLVEHYYRLAGIRDARYRQNAPAITITAENTEPASVPQFVVVVMPDRGGRILEHEPDG